MKKGIEALGAEFVPDEFHIQKYIRRMAQLADGSAEESRVYLIFQWIYDTLW